MAKFIAEIDERELAVRLAESACGMKRPEGKTTEQAFADLKESHHFEHFTRLARVAMEFFQENVSQLKPVS